MRFFAIFFAICATFAQNCFDDGNEFCIDQDDILSKDLLPGSLLLADQQHRSDNTVLNTVTKESTDGSFDGALNEMDYHRKKMNEYLCHGYIAEEIINEVSTSRVKRHPESLPAVDGVYSFLGNDNVTIHDKLLTDEGSSKYKNWMDKRTTLDDVYRHVAPHMKLKKKQDIYDDIGDYGKVTGSLTMQAPSEKISVPWAEQEYHIFEHEPAFVRPAHGDIGPMEHYYPSQQYHEHEEEESHQPPSKGKGHELSIKDFFEIALTALAFLAFGLFVIQLLMNAKNNDGMMTRRFKRHTIVDLLSASDEDLNDLSYRVLRSIEAAMIAEADSGNCLRKTLCENNRHSKQTNDGRKIWIPVWSLGMSWLSGRVLQKAPWSAMLDSVKASVLGLSGIDCASLYAACDLEKERIKRRRRRRKR